MTGWASLPSQIHDCILNMVLDIHSSKSGVELLRLLNDMLIDKATFNMLLQKIRILLESQERDIRDWLEWHIMVLNEMMEDQRVPSIIKKNADKMKSSYEDWIIVVKALSTVDKIAVILGCGKVERCIDWKMHQEYHRTLHFVDCYKWH